MCLLVVNVVGCTTPCVDHMNAVQMNNGRFACALHCTYVVPCFTCKDKNHESII